MLVEAGCALFPDMRARRPHCITNRTISFLWASLPGGHSPRNALDKIVFSNTEYRYQRHPSWAGSVANSSAVVSLDIAELVGPGAAGCGTGDHGYEQGTRKHY